MERVSDGVRLDDLDRDILRFLKDDARHVTGVEIGEALEVSDGTVRKRIEKLEQAGVITGYHPILDYRAMGVPMQVRVTCTVPVAEQDTVIDDVQDLPGVVGVVSLVGGQQNLELIVAAHTDAELRALCETLADRGISVDDTAFVNTMEVQVAETLYTDPEPVEE